MDCRLKKLCQGHCIRVGKAIKEPLHGVDLYPTLVRPAGGSLDQPLPIDGLDIWPVLTEGARSPHDALLLCGMAPGRAAIRKGNWKLLLGAWSCRFSPARHVLALALHCPGGT